MRAVPDTTVDRRARRDPGRLWASCKPSLFGVPEAYPSSTSGERSIRDFAHFLAVCSVETLAVERRVSSPFSRRWRANQGASGRRMRTEIGSLHPTTKSDTLRDALLPQSRRACPLWVGATGHAGHGVPGSRPVRRAAGAPP
jgi:hypothetical protein